MISFNAAYDIINNVAIIATKIRWNPKEDTQLTKILKLQTPIENTHDISCFRTLHCSKYKGNIWYYVICWLIEIL